MACDTIRSIAKHPDLRPSSFLPDLRLYSSVASVAKLRLLHFMTGCAFCVFDNFRTLRILRFYAQFIKKWNKESISGPKSGTRDLSPRPG